MGASTPKATAVNGRTEAATTTITTWPARAPRRRRRTGVGVEPDRNQMPGTLMTSVRLRPTATA
jgi:hypothetical protein